MPKKKLLLIEDERFMRKALARWFAQLGFDVVEGENGQEGLRLLGEFTPHILCTDLAMPHMDGFELLRHVKQHFPLLPVLVISGLSSPERVTEAMRSGAWDYITKPIPDLKTLEIVVERLMERGMLLSEREAYHNNLEGLLRARMSDLIASEEKYRNLYHHFPDALLILTPPDWTLQEGNIASQLLFETNLADHQAVTPWLFSPSHQRNGRPSDEAALEMIEIAMERGSHQFEWLHKSAKGRVFPAMVWLTRMEIGGKTYLQSVIRDLTKQEHLQAQLVQSQKMEAIGLLAGGIAHDFNNILQVILGYTEMARDTLPSDHPLHEGMVEAHEVSMRAKKLVGQLLSFGRKQLLDLTATDLNKVVRDIAHMLDRLMGKEVSLSFDLEEDMGAIWADSGQVSQILLNLCVNARDAMPQGGTITVQTNSCTIDDSFAAINTWALPGQYARMRVSDTGCGIPPETVDKIFDPFFTTKSTGEGTGLGLSMVYGLVQQHGGLINLETTPGQGCTFSLYFPFAETLTEEAKQTSENFVATGGDEVVLVVEDDPVSRKLVKKILVRAGYTVYTAENGPEAQSIFSQAKEGVSLLLTDLFMPQMSGSELYEKLGGVKGGPKVLFMSGNSPEAPLTQELLSQGLNYLQKPFSRSELLKGVRKALSPSQ